MMRLFQFRDPTPIEAFVLASDQERASKLFQLHLQAHDGDPDTLLWRERSLDDLDRDERPTISEALAIDREGLVTCDGQGRWAFLIPLRDTASH